MNERPCPDCAVKPGENHAKGCDVERCVLCGNQAIGCGCDDDPGYAADVARYGGPLRWTGEWPGDVECREWEWFCDRGTGRRCSALDPNATEDLNRLATEARWDRAAGRYVRR